MAVVHIPLTLKVDTQLLAWICLTRSLWCSRAKPSQALLQSTCTQLKKSTRTCGSIMWPRHQASWLSVLRVSSCSSSMQLTLSSTGVLKSDALLTDQATQPFNSATTRTHICMLEWATTHWSIPSSTIPLSKRTFSTEMKMATTLSPISVLELKTTTFPSDTAIRSCSATSRLTSKVSVYPGMNTTNSSTSCRE